MTKSVARLYQSFQPTNYALTLSIDPEAMTFSGTVTIVGKKTGRPSERFTFHQKELKITAATVTKHDRKGDQTLAISRINNQDTLHEVRLHTAETTYPGEYSVTMEFTGKVTKPMNGIYPCFYTEDGVDKKLIATQFESHHAREAFPCIDEPEAKATFDLTLLTPEGGTVIANTPALSSDTERGQTKTIFETTPKMSTYLLAFVYGEMGYREGQTKNGMTVRAYATRDNVQFTQTSVEDAIKCVEFFEDYFGVPYPLKKLDLAALPDFSSAAMENWGLLTYRESIMLIDPASTSIETRQLAALVICHEVSHQWFGNLVTMQWWDDLWLNESFANMMEYRGIDAIFPEWNIWEQFVAHEGVSAKRRDSLLGVQSVHIDVNHPDEINTVFDPSIVYAKGGNLLHMLMHHLGEDAFRSGLQSYFQKHQYGNTVAGDLWQAMSDASGQDIGAFMENWLGQPGYPLVSVDWTPGTDTMRISQRRFLSDPLAQNTADTQWQVPLAATENIEPTVLAQGETDVTLTAETQTPLLNHNGQSYFLPQYVNAEHRNTIVEMIADDKMSDIDRLLMLDNTILLQRGGEADSTELLDLSTAFTGERNENVWGSLSMALGEIRKLIEGDDARNDVLNSLIRGLVEPLLPELGWDDDENDEPSTLRLRGIIYALAAGAKHQPTVDQALERFRLMKTPSDLSASTRGVSYFAAARYGEPADFNRLLNLYREISSHDEKDEIAAGLTSAKEDDKNTQLLQLLRSPDVRTQDITHWLAWLLRNRYSREQTWQWLKDNWDWLTAELESDKSFDYLPRYSAGVFSKPDELEDYKQFFADKKDIISLSRAITLGEQEIASRVAWRERNEQKVKAKLDTL